MTRINTFKNTPRYRNPTPLFFSYFSFSFSLVLPSLPSLSPSVLRVRSTQRVNLVLHVADALSRARHLIDTLHPRELLNLELCAEEQGESGRVGGGREEHREGGSLGLSNVRARTHAYMHTLVRAALHRPHRQTSHTCFRIRSREAFSFAHVSP